MLEKQIVETEVETTELEEITEAIDAMWELYDESKAVGELEQAEEYARHVYLLLAKLPENQWTLSATGKVEKQ